MTFDTSGGFSWSNPNMPGRAPENGNRPKHSPLLVVVGLGVLIIAAWLIFTIVDGGSGAGKLNPVAEAAERSTSASGVRLSVDLSGTFPEFPTAGITANGAGALDFADGSGQFSVSVALPAPLGLTRFDYVISNGSMYMASPVLAPTLPPGKSWVQLPTSGDSSSGPQDPHEILKNLESKSSQIVTVGKEQVRHFETTHYRATTTQDGLEVPVDVWVDSRGLVRRMQETVSESGASMTVSVDLFDYGYKPIVAVPPSDQVVSADDFTNSIKDRLSQ